jgi:hypothetical protein
MGNSETGLTVEPLAQIPPCAEIGGLDLDEWTRNRVRDVGPGSWGSALAVGILLRLGMSSNPQDEVRTMLTGAPRPRVQVAKAWCQNLTDAQVRTLEDLVLAEVSIMEDCLQSLRGSMNPQDLALLCEAREEFECVTRVLGENGRSRLVAPARVIDLEMENLIKSFLFGGVFIDSSILSRASVGSPDAWWVSLL